MVFKKIFFDVARLIFEGKTHVEIGLILNKSSSSVSKFCVSDDFKRFYREKLKPVVREFAESEVLTCLHVLGRIRDNWERNPSAARAAANDLMAYGDIKIVPDNSDGGGEALYRTLAGLTTKGARKMVNDIMGDADVGDLMEEMQN